MLSKCCTHCVSKLGKLSSGHRTGKGQCSFEFQRRAMPKNVKPTIQLCSFHMLASLSFRLQQFMNWELPDIQAGFWKGIGTRDQTLNLCWIMEKAREFQRNNYFCFTDYAKTFDCVDHNKLWKILTEMGIHPIFLVSWETCGSRSNS